MSIKEQILEPERKVHKPWGQEDYLSITEKYALKFLRVKHGTRFSLQYHEKKLESMHLLEGKIRLTLGRKEASEELEESEFLPGETIKITPGIIHRVEALKDSVIIEASTPELLDVVRLEDDYDREGTNEP